MRLDQIRQMIADSSNYDWHKITCWGAGSGPSYKYRLHSWTTKDDVSMDVDSHGNLAIFRADVDLNIAWGLDREYDPPGLEPLELHFDWQDQFMDQKVRPFYADIFWRGNLVEREMLVSVDGGRALLPMPMPEPTERDEHGKPTEWQEAVSVWEHSFAELIHGFEHPPREYATHFSRAGFVIVDRSLEDDNK
jgi:hypothetical protein